MNRPVLFIISMAIAVGLYLVLQKLYLTIISKQIYEEACKNYRLFIQDEVINCGYTKQQAHDIANFIEAGNYQGISTAINNPNWLKEALQRYRKD